MTKAKQMLSLLLAAVLLLGMLPISAYATETDPESITVPEVNATDPPVETESASVTDETEAKTEMQEYESVTQPTEPSTEGEVLPATVPDETVPAATTTTETIPNESTPADTVVSQQPLTNLDDRIINTEQPGISTYATEDNTCLILGQVWTNVYENGSSTIVYEYPAGTTKRRSHVELHTMKVSGKWKVAYCMEPGVAISTGATYTTETMTMEQLLKSGLLSDDLTKEKVEAMGLVALYGQQKLPGQTDMDAFGKMTATQIIMWEIAIGWRNSTQPYARTNDAFSRRFLDKSVAGAGCLVNNSQRYGASLDLGYANNIQTAYKEIAAKVEKHFLVPSFAEDQESKAPTILLLPDGNGNYTATVTDTNGILSEYTLPTIDGVTFTKNGNNLTISTTKEFDKTLVAPTKTVPNFEDQPYYYWYNGDYQTLIGCAAEPSYDPVPAYFNIQSKPDEGTGVIRKVSTNGGTVQGWKFRIWDSSWNWVADKTTDANGEISLTLEPGSYYVREIGAPDSQSGKLDYWVMDTMDRTLTVEANKTSTVEFTNKYLGKLQIQKSTNTGGDLAGWVFEVKNSSGNVVATLTTGSDGSVTSDQLEPGTYYVKEIGGPSGVWNSGEWFFDVTTSGGVVVGSQNLFDNSAFNGTSHWSGTNGTGHAAVTYDGKNCLKVDPSVGTKDVGYGVQTNIKNISAGKYTFSADVYVAADRNIVVQAWTGSSWSGVGGNKTVACKAGWNHIEHTFNLTQDYDSIHVGFGGSKSYGEFYIYHPKLEQGSQATAWTDSRTVTITAGSTATHNVKNIKGGKIAVQKSTNTGKYLSGWLFEVKDSSGKLITTLETDNSGYAVTDVLFPGTYTVTEVGHTEEEGFDPDLWVMDAVSTHEVEISADTYEEFKTVFYRNDEKGTGTIEKVVLNGGSVEGWDFKIIDTAGNTVFEGETNADGLLNFALKAGTYYVYETEVREHYINDAAEYKTVEIIAGEAAEVVTFTNTYTPPPGVAQIMKTSTNGGTVVGWTFIIVDSSGAETEVVTDESGVIAVELEPGSYKVYEKPISDDYWIQDETVYEFTLQSEEVKELPFTNHWVGELEIVKTLLQPDDGTLDGWTFLIEKVAEVDGEITVESSFTAVTDENGLISQFIEPGTYRITEVLEENSLWEPTGDNPQTVEIIAGEKISVAFENRLKPGRIEIHKCDISGAPLAGAKFLLEWSEDGEVWMPITYNDTDILVTGGCSSPDLTDGTLTTKEDGIISFKGLHPMLQYRLTELEAPEGYQLLSDYAYVGQLPADTLEIQRTVVNFKLFTMPSVGSIGTTKIITGGMFLTIFALVLCCVLYFPVLSGKTAVKKKYNTKGKNTMKTNINRILSLLMVICLTITMALPAFAAESAATAIIDTTKTGSITLNKYDMTAATADGVFETNSFVTTGTVDEAAESVLAEYAIQGVIFSYVKVADIVTYSANETGHKTMVLYAFDEGTATTQLLTALGLTAADAYSNVEGEAGKLYFISDTLIDALAAKLASNSSILKNDLEAFMDDNNAAAMPETDANGKSAVTGLDLGLYLLVETYVPENVSKTTAPFFTSVPSTTIDGDNWNYDITLYPKNETDAPDLEKTLRESKPDTGKHNGTTDDITDGYAHTGTASDGDVVDYQIISSLPKITSNATALTTYTFADTLSKGIEYNKNDVLIEWYTDAACTDLITTWTEADGKFAVVYGDGENDATTMTITMTDAGLDEINNSTAVYDADSLFRGYSDCTIRITYAATVNSSADVIYGDNGNPNEVTLTWKRTNTNYYDTLTDDCHVFVYALDLTKYFSDNNGNFADVNFVIYNETDGYWVVAEQDTETGIYYVTDHAAEEADATVFVPTADGKITVKGIEDDTYIITETATDDGYILLKDAITVVITAAGDGEICTVCGKEGVTASATVDGDAVAMTEDNGSLSAVVNFSVVNERGYDIPETGDEGTVMLTVWGTLTAVSALCIAIMALFKKTNNHTK